MTDIQKNNPVPNQPVGGEKKRTVIKVLIIGFFIVFVGVGAAISVYIWQQNEGIRIRQELEQARIDKEDAIKNKEYLAKKEEREKALADMLLNANMNTAIINANENENENGNENKNENSNAGATDEEDTNDNPVSSDESPDISTDIDIADSDPGETNENVITVGTGFTIPKDTPIGYIKKLYEKDGKFYMDIDYIQWFLGEDAIPEIEKDGKCEEWGEGEGSCYPMGGFYIRNMNPKIRTFEISPDTEVFMTTYPPSDDGEDFGGKISYSEFKKLFSSTDDYSYLKDEPYYIIIDHEKIIIIAEQFIP